MYQIWEGLDKNCDHYRGRNVCVDNRHTLKWFCMSNAMNCTGQTIISMGWAVTQLFTIHSVCCGAFSVISKYFCTVLLHNYWKHLLYWLIVWVWLLFASYFCIHEWALLAVDIDESRLAFTCSVHRSDANDYKWGPRPVEICGMCNN